MYYIYILRSLKHARYYIGSTSNLEDRLRRHNGGQNKSTKGGIPWTVVYFEEYLTYKEAYKRELQIKKYKSGRAFRELVNKTI